LFATERLVLTLTAPSLNAPHAMMAVWQLAPDSGYAMGPQFESEISFDAWSVALSVGQHAWHHKGCSLETLVANLLSECLPSPHKGFNKLGFKAPAAEVALFLPDAHFRVFEIACLPQWGRQDIEAECWVEATQLTQTAMTNLALDMSVYLDRQGRLRAKAMVCDKQSVQQYAHQFSSWGLKLTVVSSHSQSRELPC